jgi:SAM-dependent methyltransferase
MTSAARDLTEQNRLNWQRKPVLREIYGDLYRKMAAECVPGQVLEIGGGSGNFKAFRPDTISTDIVTAPWLDAVADAQCLPFADGVFTNIVMFDVLHHIEFPALFFDEATRVLRRGGRIVMVEPAITAGSWFFYRFLHQEPVRMDQDVLGLGRSGGRHGPYDGNQAIPTLLATSQAVRMRERFPDLAVRNLKWLSLFAYPASGGFKRWSLIPAAAVGPLLRLEDRLLPWLGRLIGFRLLLTLEKRSDVGRGAG